MSLEVIVEVDGKIVLVDGKYQTVPFTKFDRDYLTEYVRRHVPEKLIAFKNNHVCSKCASLKSSAAVIQHKEELFWKRAREGKIFMV